MKEIVLGVDVVVEPDNPGYHAYAPAFKGLHVDGDTVEEALQNARDAIELYVQDMIECGEAQFRKMPSAPSGFPPSRE